MTHNKIYTKFMIEYDKANVTSSYPSLTKYEAATLLDRAYLALISRKLTGNNTRRVPFEYDTKAIEDLRPLVTTKRFKQKGGSNIVLNEYKFGMPDDLLYYIEGVANYGSEREIVLPVNHQIARKFKYTNSNIPWVNHPVSYIEGSEVYVLIDPFLHTSSPDLDGTYIKKPASFVESLKKTEDDNNDGNNSGDNDDGGDNNGGGNDSGGDNGGGNSGGDDQTTVTPPVITPDDLTFANVLYVNITAAKADHIVYRVNNGTWNEYTWPITITETSTIEAYVVLNNIVSSTVTKTYTKQLQQQTTINPPRLVGATSFIDNTYVAMYADEGCQIKYTKDGSDPLTSTTVSIYSGLIKIEETTIIKAVAWKDDHHSKVVTLTYVKQLLDSSTTPTVIIEQCKYVPASSNQAESIYIKHQVNLNNVGVRVYLHTMITDDNKTQHGEIIPIIYDVESKVYELLLPYTNGDKKVRIRLRGRDNDILYSEVFADITDLPSNAPEAPDPEEGFDDNPSAPSLGEQTSNNLGEATLGEIILQ